MKLKTFIVATFICASLGFHGCSLDTGGPKNTVRKFYQHLSSQQVDKAISLFPSSVTDSEEFNGELMKFYMEAFAEGLQESGVGIQSIKFKEENITGDTAKVTFIIMLGSGETSTETAGLVRENGVWKMDPETAFGS